MNKKAKGPVTPEKTTNNSPVVQDTFNLRDLVSNPVLQKDILLDTISIETHEGHINLYMIFPVMPAKENKQVTLWVNRIITNKKKEFIESSAGDTEVYDSTSGLIDGWHMYIEPRLLYRTDSLLSFALEDGAGASGMPAGYSYQILNFDFKRKKEITLGDYFILNTEIDSLFLENILKRCYNEGFSFERHRIDPLHFAFDSSTVYFLFDRYDIMGWGISSVKKKYIIDHINAAYR